MDTDSPTDEPPYVRVWEYEVAPEREEAFRHAYGADGAWVQLFRRALGYLGTTLTPPGPGQEGWRTTDRWESEAAWVIFRRRFSAEYEALDRACESLTVAERLVQEG